ncbi:cytochrome P450 [Podospora aff. communis PSN243]|uniref:Cytochrome P450 n=1 Tax=Podospora aff. communis PSN243 TaxID=3040156 RepID=A0AAV9GE33_9PEZI|nr:cytochrome P450 [Podospora aff. communis PSN243]
MDSLATKMVTIAWVIAALVLVKLADYLYQARGLKRAHTTGKFAEPPSVPINYFGYFRRNVWTKRQQNKSPDGKGRRQNPSQLDALTAMMNRTGWDTFQWRFLGSRTIMTRDPRNLQALHSTQFGDFGMGNNRKNNFRFALGRGIFAADGDEWRCMRTVMRPYFQTDHVRHPNLEPHIQKLLRRIETGPDGWTPAPVDLQPLFYTFALDVSCEIFFGLTPQDQQELSASYSAFSSAFDTVQRHLSTRTKLGWAYFLWDGPKFRRAIAETNRFIDEVILRAVRKKSGNQKDQETTTPTFLDHLLASTHSNSPTHIRSQLLHLLIASRDTVATTLCWTLHNLARHPQVYTSLRQSILSPPPSSSLQSNTLLHHTLLESLRLNPAIPLNTRTALTHTSLPHGGGPHGQSSISVRAGDEVLYSVYALHRDPRIWGNDAGEFRPGRWAELESKKKRGSRRWEFLPFGGGPRVCLGQRVGMREMEGVVGAVVGRFGGVEAEGVEERGAKEVISELSPQPQAMFRTMVLSGRSAHDARFL